MKKTVHRILLVSVALFVLIPFYGDAQNFAAKTNLLYDLTTTVNLGAEAGLSPHWSLEVSGNGNFWSFSDGKRWKQWMVQPELRYWLCQRMGGHFFAAHLVGGQYNVGHVDLDFLSFLGNNFKEFKDYRHQGYFAGAGLAYGYAWLLGKHWNLEAEIGVGYVYTGYDVYECAGCGRKVDKDRHKNYVGPTKAAINLVYIF